MPTTETKLDLKKIAVTIFKIFRYLMLASFVYCLFGLGNTVKKSYGIWLYPQSAEGNIVDYKETSWQSQVNGSYETVTTKLPVVEFNDTGNETIRFTDSFGNNAAVLGKTPVIYSLQDPHNARVDKGFFTWIDSYIWLFGAVISFLGIVQTSQRNIDRRLAMLETKIPTP